MWGVLNMVDYTTCGMGLWNGSYSWGWMGVFMVMGLLLVVGAILLVWYLMRRNGMMGGGCCGGHDHDSHSGHEGSRHKHKK